MLGQHSEGETPPHLDPKTNSRFANVAWESGGWFLPLPAALFAAVCTGGSGRTRLGAKAGTQPHNSLISPLHRAPWYPAVWGHILTPSLKAIPLAGFVGAAIRLGAPEFRVQGGPWCGQLWSPQTLRRPTSGCERDSTGRGQAIPPLQHCPLPFPGGVTPPFTWGRQAINAGSRLVRSKCGWAVSKGLSATQTLNFKGYWVASEFNLLTANKAFLKVSPSPAHKLSVLYFWAV